MTLADVIVLNTRRSQVVLYDRSWTLHSLKSLVIIVNRNLLYLLMILTACNAINVDISFNLKFDGELYLLYLILLCLLFAKVFL